MPGSECCEHCAEIPPLREEVAALRARLNALTTLPLSASDPLPLQAELAMAAKTPPRQMPLFGPVHGPPLPRVDHESSLQAKVGLYRTLFAGRSDVYAYRWENTAEGTKGWAPKRRPGTTRDNPEYLPLTDEIISAHLTKENPAACGLYVTLPDSTCRLLVCDFDGGTWRLDAAAYAEAAAWAGVPAAVEISRSGDGAHVWTFFSESVAAADARAMGAALLHEAMAIRGEMDIESYDRLFPAQDYLPRRGFGNLIALPLEGRCRQNRTTLFVDPATFEPYQDQFAYLSSLERMTRRDVVERAEELQPPTVGPAVRLHRSPLAAEPPPPHVIKAELSGMLAIRRAGLPPSLLSSLKHLASLHNPEFYSRQQIGLSVWGAPRMLRCYSESLDRLFLPRGVADRAAKLIEKAGSRLAITDLRSAPAELEIEFTGTLRAEQQAAVDAVAAYELGVLVAPPGAGKTVMGADGREEIMFMHCGQVRHKIPSATDLIQELHVHPTATTIRDDIDSDTPGILQSIIIPALVSDRIRTAQIIDDVVHAIRRGRNCLVMAGRTEHVDQLAAELNARGLAPMVLHGSISPGKRRVILKQLADWDPVHAREPMLLAATASYIGEGFDCPALDTLFLCSPSSSESIITQNVGRIMRDLPGKTTVEVHDYADTRVPMLTRMHGKRLTAYKKIGFTNPVIGEIPLFPGTEMAVPAMAAPAPAHPSKPAAVSAAEVRTWAKENGLDVSARGRLRPEIWDQYRVAHLA